MVRQGGDEESGAVCSNHSSIRSVRSDRSPPPSSLRSNRSARSDRSPPPPSSERADHLIKPTISPLNDKSPPKTEEKHVSFLPSQVRNNNNEFDPENPDRYVWWKYGQYLITKVTPWVFNRKNINETSYEVNLAEVQRMYLVQLRIRLAGHITQWAKTRGEENLGIGPKNGEDGAEGSWEDDLHRYVQALQDYDYMDKCRQNLSIDPFRITGEGMLDRIILDTSLRDIDDSRMRERDVRRWDEKVRPIIRSRTDNRYKRLVARISVSAVGAGFLIGPMWLMMLKTGLYVALISTSIFVAVFGIMMACVLDEHINVLSSTAAYAAVLVVFVGLRGEATGDTG